MKIKKPQKRKKSHKKTTQIDSTTYWKVYHRDGGKCVVCGSRSGIEQHHIKPRSRLGAGSENNLVTLCKKCHYVKLHGMGDFYTKERIFLYMIQLGLEYYRSDLESLRYKEGKLNEKRNSR